MSATAADGVGPVSAMVTVKPTCWPCTAAVTLLVWVMVSAGISTGTLTEQRGSVLPAGQLLPAAVVTKVLASTLFPVSGLLTVTVPVMVTEPPTGMLPVQVISVGVSVIVPEVAVWSPSAVASSRTLLMLAAIVIPVYGAWPALVNTVVNRTTDPGVVVGTFELSVIVSTATGTVAVQDGSALPAAQLLPGVTEVIVLARILLPVSGLLTVTENVTVADAPTARFPVQVRFGLANETLPAVAAASLS